MNELRDFITDPVVLGSIVLFVLIMVATKWFFKKMEMNPVTGADGLSDGEEEGYLSDAALQSKVGTPRARRLQPARVAASELNLPELNTALPSVSEAGLPADSLAMAGEAAFARKPEADKITASIPSEFARKETAVAALAPDPSKGAGGLPPLASELPQPAVTNDKKPEPPAGSLVSSVSISEIKPETKGTGTTGLPPLAAATGPLHGVPTASEKIPAPSEKPLAPVPGVLPPIAAPLTATPEPPAAIKPPAPEPPKPIVAGKLPEPPKPADKPAAVPVEPAAVKSPQPTPDVVPADLNDVKKQKTPPLAEKPEAANSGLILIPSKPDAATDPATAVKAPEAKTELPPTPAKPEEAPATPPAESPSFFSKMMGRQRIFMPPSAPATSKPEPDSANGSPAAVEAVPETPAALAGSTAPAKPEPPAPVEVKSETSTPAKPEPPVSVPVKAEPPPTQVSAPVGSLTITPEKPAAEPAKPAGVSPAVPAATASPAPAHVPKAPAKPEPASAKPEPVPAKPSTPQAAKPATTPDIPAEDGTPAAPLVDAPASGKSAAPTPAKSMPPIAPLVPAAPVAKPPVPAAPPTTPSVSTPQRTMPQDSTTALPHNARAAAQLTLGFEITSLQLTPFFKLGAVQLRPLSNIVSLHLVASSAADSPLAAGISFQIVTVELNEAAHLKSILLKPLPQAQPATVPSQKLAVDNVQITQAGENAPISVTTSESTSTAVQLLADFSIASMDFTPSFEIGSLRLEPTSNSVLLRLAPSQRPAALDLPPSFEVANVQLGNDAQLSGMRLTPGSPAKA